MKRSVRWLLLAFLGASAGFTTAIPAAAQQFVAIAFSQSRGTYGYWHGASSRGRAEEGALQRCGPGCQVVVWARDACAALAVGDGNGYGYGWSEDEREARRVAMGECRKQTSGCEVKVKTCADD
jgi:hypothetical protein